MLSKPGFTDSGVFRFTMSQQVVLQHCGQYPHERPVSGLSRSLTCCYWSQEGCTEAAQHALHGRQLLAVTLMLAPQEPEQQQQQQHKDRTDHTVTA